MERRCRRGRKLSKYNPGALCFRCQEKKREVIGCGDKPYYNVWDMMKILGLDSEEQVRRKGRAGLIPGKVPGIKQHLYLKEAVDKWIRPGGRIEGKPTSPLQEEAHALCIKGDHSRLHDERFNGHAYKSEDFSELRNSTVNVGYKRTCYFCGYVEVIPIG